MVLMVAVPRPFALTGILPVSGALVITQQLSLESSIPAVRVPDVFEVKLPTTVRGLLTASIPERVKANEPARAVLEKAELVCWSIVPLPAALASKRVISA